ncbi:MAG: DUF2520 domain-containing protein [Polyangia bacterium]
MKLVVVGQGRVGSALVPALVAAGVDARGVSARSLPPGLEADVYVLAVRDPSIAAVTRAVLLRHRGAPPTVLHTAGGVPSQVLRDAGAARAAVMHPLVAFAGVAPILAGSLFAVEGDAADVAESLVLRLGGTPLRLDAQALVRYHAAAVLTANHVLALVDQSRDLMASVGADPRLAEAGLSSLFSAVAANLSRLGLPAALTGPIARGDVAAVRGHLSALTGEARATYVTTAVRLCSIARRQGSARVEDLLAIEALLALYLPAFVD